MITLMTTMVIIMGSDFTMEERLDLVVMNPEKIRNIISRKELE